MSDASSKASQNWFAKHKVLTGIGAFIVLLIVFGSLSGGTEPSSTSSDSSSTPTPAPQQVSDAKEESKTEETRLKVTAEELYDAYEANTLSADAKYKGKKLEITGVVDGIGKDIVDQPYISLGAGDMITTVQCMLQPSAVEQASKLSKGASITLYGEDPSYLINVIVDNCEFSE